MQDKSALLDWLTSNFFFHRPVKSKELLIYPYGEASAPKTVLEFLLSKVLRISFVSPRPNDFYSPGLRREGVFEGLNKLDRDETRAEKDVFAV